MKAILLGLTALAAIGLAQEGVMVSFDPNYICYNHEPPRLDFALLIYLAWRGVSWLGLVDEASLWTSVAMVWVLSFGIMKAMEALAARARLVELRLSSTYAE